MNPNISPNDADIAAAFAAQPAPEEAPSPHRKGDLVLVCHAPEYVPTLSWGRELPPNFRVLGYISSEPPEAGGPAPELRHVRMMGLAFPGLDRLVKELPQPVRFFTYWAITTQELRSVPLVAISPTSGTEWEHMTLNDRSVRNKNLRTFQDLYADLKRRTPGAIERELVAKEIHLLEQMNATPGAASQQPSATAGTLAATGAAHGDEISSQNPDVISPEGALTQQPTAANEGIFASALRRGT